MNKLGLALSLVLAISLTGIVTAQNTPNVSVVKFSLYDNGSSTWTNITMRNFAERTVYITESGNEYYNGLQGELYFDWNGFEDAMNVASFANLSYEIEGSPNMIVEVLIGNVNHTLEIKELPVFFVEDLGITKMVNMLSVSLNRATGFGIDHAVWPVDLQTWVLESFPEQYAVTVSFQRGGDLLDYVVEENVTLFAGGNLPNGNINAEWFENAIHAESKRLEISSGGFSSTVQFSNFRIHHNNVSYTNDLQFNELTIVVIMESGNYISVDSNGTIDVRQSNVFSASQFVERANENFDVHDVSSIVDTQTDALDDTDNVSLPFGLTWIAGILLPVAILNRRKSTN